MMFMAKGMGRPEGDAVVWDIALGDGPMTINGVPFGQPAGKNAIERDLAAESDPPVPAWSRSGTPQTASSPVFGR